MHASHETCRFCGASHPPVLIFRSPWSFQKVQELKHRLRFFVGPKAAILLLSGPPGVGKRSTVQQMLKENHLPYRFLYNPQYILRSLRTLLHTAFENSTCLHIFVNVIPRVEAGTQRELRDLILKQFFEELQARKSKVIFIATDSGGPYTSHSPLRTLFPSNFSRKDMQVMHVPPITLMSIKRSLSNVTQNCPTFRQDAIEEAIAIAAETKGDLQNALLTLQWILYISRSTPLGREGSYQCAEEPLEKYCLIDLTQDSPQNSKKSPGTRHEKNSYINIGHATARLLCGKKEYRAQDVLRELSEVTPQQLLSFFQHNHLRFYPEGHILSLLHVEKAITFADAHRLRHRGTSSHFLSMQCLPLNCVIASYHLFNPHPISATWEPCVSPPYHKHPEVSTAKWTRQEDEFILFSMLFAFPSTFHEERASSLHFPAQDKSQPQGKRRIQEENLATQVTQKKSEKLRFTRTRAPTLHASENSTGSFPKRSYLEASYIQRIWLENAPQPQEAWKDHLRDNYPIRSRVAIKNNWGGKKRLLPQEGTPMYSTDDEIEAYTESGGEM